MKRIFSVLAFLALSAAATTTAQAQGAQADPEAEVRAVIDRLFDGMRAQDTTVMRSTIHPSARLQSVGATREGTAVLRQDSVDAFIRSIAGAAGRTLDERLRDVEVRVDGNLATVWAPYAFYLDGNLSHCGVNAFQLFRGAEGWKITQIIDTRRRQGCAEIPPAAPRQ